MPDNPIVQFLTIVAKNNNESLLKTIERFHKTPSSALEWGEVLDFFKAEFPKKEIEEAVRKIQDLKEFFFSSSEKWARNMIVFRMSALLKDQSDPQTMCKRLQINPSECNPKDYRWIGLSVPRQVMND